MRKTRQVPPGKLRLAMAVWAGSFVFLTYMSRVEGFQPITLFLIAWGIEVAGWVALWRWQRRWKRSMRAEEPMPR